MHIVLSPLAVGSLLFIVALASWRWMPRWLKRLALAVGIGLIILASPLGANALIYIQEQRAHEDCAQATPDTIVVLAGGMATAPQSVLDHASLGGASLRRLVSAIALHAEHPDAGMVIVGTSGYAIAESDVMAGLAERMGVPRAALRTETRSLSTWQNAAFTAGLDPPVSRHIWLVTSALHMPRAAYAFRRMGFEVCPAVAYEEFIGPESPGYLLPQGTSETKAEDALHEIVGEISYRLGILRGKDREARPPSS